MRPVPVGGRDDSIGLHHGFHVSAGDGVVPIPRPRMPVADRLRRLLPQPEPSSVVDVDAMLGDLVAVAVGTSREGLWEEHGSFLLQTSDERWHLVPLTDPSATELTARLRELPGFDENKLLELVSSRTPRLVVLWRKPTACDPCGEGHEGADNIVRGYD